MKHLEVAAVIAGVGIIVLLAVACLWVILSGLLGPGPAAAGLGLVALVALTAAVLDWATEKRKA